MADLSISELQTTLGAAKESRTPVKFTFIKVAPAAAPAGSARERRKSWRKAPAGAGAENAPDMEKVRQWDDW